MSDYKSHPLLHQATAEYCQKTFKDFQLLASLESAVSPGQTIPGICNPSVPTAMLKNANCEVMQGH